MPKQPPLKPRGRPKVLQGPVQVINLHIETHVCNLIDQAVLRRPEIFGSRSDFIRAAVQEKLLEETDAVFDERLASIKATMKKYTDLFEDKVGSAAVREMEEQFDAWARDVKSRTPSARAIDKKKRQAQ